MKTVIQRDIMFLKIERIPLSIQHESVFDDNYKITLELLSAGAIVNVPGFDFTTPLHVATHHNNLPIIKLLLKFGADPTARDISGRCPE